MDGERNGEGKEYYGSGELLFKGQFLNDEYWNGKGYKKDGMIDFQIVNGSGKKKIL